jgi:hypothetical protein
MPGGTSGWPSGRPNHRDGEQSVSGVVRHVPDLGDGVRALQRVVTEHTRWPARARFHVRDTVRPDGGYVCPGHVTRRRCRDSTERMRHIPLDTKNISETGTLPFPLPDCRVSGVSTARSRLVKTVSRRNRRTRQVESFDVMRELSGRCKYTRAYCICTTWTDKLLPRQTTGRSHRLSVSF